MLVGGVKQGILVQNEKTVPHTNRLNVSFYSSPPLHICLNIETSLSSAPGFSCQSSCDRDGGKLVHESINMQSGWIYI